MHSYKTSIHSYSYKTLPNIPTKHSIAFLQNTPIHSYKTSIHSYKTSIHSYKTSIHSYKTSIHSYKTFLCIPTKHLYIHIPTKHSQTLLQNTPLHSYKTLLYILTKHLYISKKHLYILTKHLYILIKHSYAFLQNIYTFIFLQNTPKHYYKTLHYIPTKHSYTFLQLQRCRSVFNIGGYNSAFLPFFRDFEILGGIFRFCRFFKF